MDVSIVVPVFNEQESLPELVSWIDRVNGEASLSWEIILVDDGSTDGSWSVIENLSKEYPSLRAVKFARNYGKSAALHTGFQKAAGDVVITMDADLQDSPDEVPELYRMIREDGFDLVSGWKQKRYDPLSKTLPSRFFNATVHAITGIRLHDFNCGLKAYRRDVVKNIEVYGDMHRYIPVLAQMAGFRKIGEKVVQHRARKYGVSKYGWQRFFNGYLDLLTILFMSRFGKSPMHIFGFAGTLIFLIGFLAAGWIGVQKLIILGNGLRAPLVTTNPWFYISLVAMILGFQLFIAGFLGELVSRNGSDRNKYIIEDNI